MWESAKCEERSGCKGERMIINISQNIIPETFFRNVHPFYTPSLPPQFLLLLMW